jgi:N6-L-threonylcarbamoyladenine synthase
MSILILAIETSCDESAVSILKEENGVFLLLANEISSQVKMHAAWGGVIPNLAAREHLKNLPLIFKSALEKNNLKIENIDAIAVTQGPGLIPALLVGVEFAKTISYKYNIPLLGIHHIEGHIYANFIGISNFQFPRLPDEQAISKQIQNSKIQITNSTPRVKIINKDFSSKIENCELPARPGKIENSPNIKFPILCLVVSGGHTQLVFMKNHFDYKIIGQTLDDAVGEAFDKVARILGIGYPGGPAVAAKAAEFKISNLKFQNKNTKNALDIQNSDLKIDSKFKIQNSKFQIKFPRPMINKQGFNFSFSGLKTAVLYETKKNPELIDNKNYIAEVCYEFQQACIDVLVSKTIKAAEQYKPKTIMLAGGVSANLELRSQLDSAIEKNLKKVNYKIPNLDLTGDNAAMIAMSGILRWQKMTNSQKEKSLSNWKILEPNANLKLS